jgi:hypothetical protein
MQSAAIALFVMFAGPFPAGSQAPTPGHVWLAQADSAHTLFTPNAPDPGRSGQTVQLPQGGLGVTTGGTANYQPRGTPNGSAIAVPNGNNTSSVIGPGGQIGTTSAPH